MGNTAGWGIHSGKLKLAQKVSKLAVTVLVPFNWSSRNQENYQNHRQPETNINGLTLQQVYLQFLDRKKLSRKHQNTGKYRVLQTSKLGACFMYSTNFETSKIQINQWYQNKHVNFSQDEKGVFLEAYTYTDI